MKNKVAVLFGGPSSEHEVSLVSGKTLCLAFAKGGYDVLPVGISKKGQWKTVSFEELEPMTFQKPIDLEVTGTSTTPAAVSRQVNFAFPICHGPFGEDGELQSLLTQQGLPFLGTDAEGCQLNLNKRKTKEFLKQKTTLPQVPFVVVKTSDYSLTEALQTLEFPLFVKPASLGSSIGISKVTSAKDWEPALRMAFQYDDTVVIEQGVDAREVECAIVDGPEGLLVSGFSEVVTNSTQHDFYSYEAKYLDPNGAQFIYPAPLPSPTQQSLVTFAKEAFSILQCRDYARVDFFVERSSGKILFNEINTHPGFTAISQFPQLFEKINYPLPDLVNFIVAGRQKREPGFGKQLQ